MYKLYCNDCGEPFESESSKKQLCEKCKLAHYKGQRKQQKEEVKKPKKIRPAHKSKSIQEVAYLAKEAGMSYGKYVSLFLEPLNEFI
jgi:hypothetical protein